MQLACLRFFIGGNLHNTYSNWRGILLSLIFPLFRWPRLKRGKLLLKTEQEPRAVLAA
jgi:hypothetical protein